MKDYMWAGIAAFALGLVLTPVLIPLLQKLKFGQVIREDGPQGHLKKAGTPTMGGLAFIVSITAVSAFLLPSHPEILPVLLVMLGCGAVGFADDFLEIVKKKNEEPTKIILPISGREWTMPWWLYLVLFFLMFLGTDNGVNLNDGLDGLCASVTGVEVLFLALLSLKYGAGLESICLAAGGALLAYLLFNTYPAKLFMGDTGSLALGGFLAAAFITMRQPLMILIAGFIYFAESVSVIIQRYYFKATHGKRFFRMTPIHHHFELGGWSEPRIVIVFTTVTFWCCVLAYFLA